jgi:hypothetical protein
LGGVGSVELPVSFDHPTFVAVDDTVLNTAIVFPRQLQHSVMLLSGTA